MMGRYLMFISYIGTAFNGMQRQTGRPVKTVAGVLEEALRRLCADSFSFITTSSRTDRGVHALCNTIHADLKPSKGRNEFDANFITMSLNRSLKTYQEDVRVLKTIRVNDNFHSRYLARQRTYVYQVCLCRHHHQLEKITIPSHPFYSNRSFVVRRPVDVDLVSQAAKIIQGTHDFKAFTSPSILAQNVTTYRHVDVSVEPDAGFFSNHAAPEAEQFMRWNFVFRSQSFLYKQVRKMSAVMLAAGLRDITLDDVRQLVNEPDTAILRKTNIFDVPPYALYLVNVQYDPEDLVFTPTSPTPADSSSCG